MKNSLNTLKNTMLIGLLLLVSLNSFAQNEKIKADHWKAGDVRFDESKWTEVIVGNMPLVICVPHGGALHDERIPDRDCTEYGRIVKGADGRTIQTARAIEAAFLKLYNKKPYIVISHLSRRKVDQNRDVDMATCGDPLAKQAWDNFHLSIDTALSLAVSSFGDAVFIDLHGHGHPNQRLEIGYSLDKAQLNKAFQKKDLTRLGGRSSLANYLKMNADAKIHNLLFGKYSFGSLIHNYGIPATPAMQDPHPVDDENFFAGGYNTRRYTSAKYPNVFGWQIECNNKGVRDTEASRERFGIALTKSYSDFVKYLSTKNAE